IGGCDIVCEMHENGELQTLLKEVGAKHPAPQQ
ncbi:MAG TPA: glutaredoxin, partial [Spongiibacteraceae bacterium]|nr:glutaredoxin [Spongiibacteraceae bacterium]